MKIVCSSIGNTDMESVKSRYSLRFQGLRSSARLPYLRMGI